MRKDVFISLVALFIYNGIHAQKSPKSFHINNKIVINNIDRDLSRLVVILPLAQTNQYQEVYNVSFENGETLDIPGSDDKYIRWTYSENLPLPNQSREVGYEFDVVLNPIDFDFSTIKTLYPYDTTSLNYIWYTGKSGAIVDPTNPTINRIAGELWAESTDILDYSRRCYEYVASNYAYLNPLTGLHPLQDILNAGGGDCGNLSSIFISLLRNKKIPARHVVTVRPDRTFHVWADFYLETYGWIPVDVTFKNSDPYGDYFGKYDGDGIVMTKGVWLELNKGNGESYHIDLLQHFNWWIWYKSGSEVKTSYELVSKPAEINNKVIAAGMASQQSGDQDN